MPQLRRSNGDRRSGDGDVRSRHFTRGHLAEGHRGLLYAPDIPPLDLVVRTGGDQRLSNFMLWRAAYAELVFTPTYWPNFTTHELDMVLDDYAARPRRSGS